MRLSGILKPEYLYRPSQIIRRIATRKTNSNSATFSLPFGARISCDPQKAIGQSIERLGIYDLTVAETIWRLLSAGDAALDIGANIGQMALAMAFRVGPKGRVLAFEPHPEIFNALVENIRLNGLTNVQPHRVALSETDGTANLIISAEFASNDGVASLETNLRGESVSVITRRLDNICDFEHVGLLKIDVEGHELSVFKGAQRLLSENRIRHIIYEDHAGYPSAVSSLLEGHGYKIHNIARRLFGPLLQSPTAPRVTWEPSNYLATLDSATALKPSRRSASLQE